MNGTYSVEKSVRELLPQYSTKSKGFNVSDKTVVALALPQAALYHAMKVVSG